MLDAIDDKDLHDLMESRINWLESRLPTSTPGTTTRITDDFAVAVQKARANGRMLPADEDNIEDLGLLVWEEIDENGDVITKIGGKLTEKGQQQALDLLGDINQTTTAGSEWQKILNETTVCGKILRR